MKCHTKVASRLCDFAYGMFTLLSDIDFFVIDCMISMDRFGRWAASVLLLSCCKLMNYVEAEFLISLR